MYTVGATIRLTNTFQDATGTAVDPDPAPTVTIVLPDGTTDPDSPFTASKDDTGVYHYDYTTTTSGVHQYYFTGTVSGLVGASLPDVFTVAPTSTAALISLADAKAALNATGTIDDDELLLMIRAATEIVNGMAGYTLATSVTETLEPTVDKWGRCVLVLSQAPVMTVQSITPVLDAAPAVTVDDDALDQPAGIYSTTDTLLGPVKVEYTAGRSVVPAALQEACRMLVQNQWETQQGGAAIPNLGGDETSAQSTYGMRFQVLQLLEMASTRRPAGVA